MKSKILLFLRGHLTFEISALAFICAFISVACVLNAGLESTRLVRLHPQSFASGWRALADSGELTLAEPSRPAANAVGRELTLVNTLPDELPNNVSLAFQTKNESVRVLVDGETVYTYGETPQTAYGHGVGAVWNLAPLPDGSGGKAVAVELSPWGERTGLAPYRFLLGNRGDVIYELLMENLDMLVICLVLTIVGGASLLFSLYSLARKNRRAWEATFYFSAFVLLAALWTATDSGLLQFAFNNKGVSYMLFGCSFYLLCTPFAMFMASVLPECGRRFRTLAAINSAYATLRIVLYMCGLVNFETALWLLHLLMSALIIIINITIWMPLLRRKKAGIPELCVAVSAFTVIAGLSLLNFYVNDKLDQLRSGYSSGYYVGILVFVLITILGAARQERLVRQRAFKADFFESRAYTDELTGLLNVRGFDDKCEALLRGAAPEVCLAVLDFDVNFFSQFNASYGLERGDELLCLIAERLREVCGPDELCARQEADHFVCMLRGESRDAILKRVRESDSETREDMSRRMLLFSYGVAEVTDRSLSPAKLRNQALVAKRTVKGNYESNIAVYDRGLHEHQLREMALLSGFETALHRGEYVIFLQPKISVASELLGGAEALVRRIAPDGSVTSAGPIIEALEQKGFVAKLDYYIFEEVCKFQRRCLSENRLVCTISSNFSRVHLYDPEFPERIASLADKYDVPHGFLEVELTETVFLAGKDILRSVVRDLRERGFSVSIDDFGSGYSSLNILKDVEVDAIKLDREFLADFAENDRAETIIEHTISLAQSMGIISVAEGIETPEQLAFLRRLGCDLVQGYYYSRPIPAVDFAEKYLPL